MRTFQIDFLAVSLGIATLDQFNNLLLIFLPDLLATLLSMTLSILVAISFQKVIENR